MVDSDLKANLKYKKLVNCNHMNTLISYIIIISLLAGFVIMLLRKWGVVEWVQVHGNDFFSKMFSCDFCLSWWVSLTISVIVFLVTRDALVLSAPFGSTMLTRILL